MSTKTVITLTDQPVKWSNTQARNRDSINLIISSNAHSREVISSKNKADLLIISQEAKEERAFDIQLLSSFVGAPYTLIIAPEQEEQFVSCDFSQIASTLLSRPNNSNAINTNEIFPTELRASGDKHLPFSPGLNPTLCLSGYLLGPFHVLINGLILNDFSGRKAKSLLAYLLYNNRRPNFRETLMEKFWPDVGAESARNSLNVAIHCIRSIFRSLIPKKELLMYKHDRYFINPDIEVKLDHEDFLLKVKRGRHNEAATGLQDAISDYEEAARLYKGDFMEDSLYDEWSSPERENIKEGYLYVLDRLSDHYYASGKYKISQHYCRKILEKEICREDIHRRMMRCLQHTGHRDLAVKQFQKCEAALLNELDMFPSQKTIHLLDEIKRG